MLYGVIVLELVAHLGLGEYLIFVYCGPLEEAEVCEGLGFLVPLK